MPDVHRSELFSVQELKSEDLIINIKRPEQSNFDNMIESRITVHKSENSEGYTINYHMNLENDGKTDASLFVMPRMGRLVVPVFGCLPTDLRGSHYAMKSRGKDKFISLGKYNPVYNSPVYFIIISLKNQEVIVQNVRLYFHDFSFFRVTIALAFMPMPSLLIGKQKVLSTAAIRKNGIGGGNFVGEHTTWRSLELTKFVHTSFTEMALWRTDQFLKKCIEDGEIFSEQEKYFMKILCYKFSPIPIDFS